MRLDLGDDPVTSFENMGAGSSASWFAMAYSATSTGFEALRSFRGSQLDEPSCHWTSKDQPRVVTFGLSVPLGVQTIPWEMGIALWLRQ